MLHAHWKFTKRPVVRSRNGRRRTELHPTRRASFGVVLLSPTREATNAAVDDRFRLMIEAGALDEIALLDGLDGDLPALKAVGVPDLRRHLRGEIDLETAVARAQIATRQFAKRQTTWFKNQIIADIVINKQYSESFLSIIFSFIRENVDPVSLTPIVRPRTGWRLPNPPLPCIANARISTESGGNCAAHRLMEQGKMATERTMTGAAVIIRALIDQGVEVVFGYPGGAVLPIYDEIFKTNELRHVLVRHEQGAVHAAEGYARSTGKIGVVLVTSGPGATNAVTGLTDALMDPVPVICLTGQVPTHLIGNDAFQECDTTGITRPCTKHNYLVKDTEALARTMHEAFYVARSGRPGPVVVDLPKDIQFADCPYIGPAEFKHPSYRPQVRGNASSIEEAVELLANAERPIFYGGGGLINSGPAACKRFSDFVRETGYPCTLTLMGLGALPGSDPSSSVCSACMVPMKRTWRCISAM